MGCGVEELVLERFRGDTPRERYVASLERAGLAESRMARSWAAAGERAIRTHVQARPPLLEEVWFPPEEPLALGYALEVLRGQRIRVEVTPDDPAQAIFVELYRIRSDPPTGDGDVEPALLLVGWNDEEETGITYDARASASYLVRVQPELLGGGAVRISLEVGASLAFPVEDRTTRNVGSFFGDTRDGGARDHHGVDVFAPRGTPVLAATDGIAYRVGVNRLGGNVVWLRDPTGDLRQYYAHLDTQWVQTGQEVRAGDVLGLVGNTGNAITTPPHLHFGIYLRGEGPVDPIPFLEEPTAAAPALTVERDAFDRVRRTRTAGVPLRAAPSNSAVALESLPVHFPVRIVGGAGGWYRVRLPEGGEGYLQMGSTDPTEAPLAEERMVGSGAVRRAPSIDAPRVRTPEPGERVSILAWAGEWAWVATESGPGGWLHGTELDD